MGGRFFVGAHKKISYETRIYRSSFKVLQQLSVHAPWMCLDYKEVLMPSDAVVAEFKDNVKAIRGLDKEGILRPNLGEASLESKFGKKLEEIIKKLEFLATYSDKVHDNVLNQANKSVLGILNSTNEQINRDAGEYINQSDQFISQVNEHLNALLMQECHFISAAIQEKGFLQDEGIKQAYENAVENLKKETDAIVEDVKKTTTSTIEEAKVLASEIEGKARRTAKGVSIEVAQKQFTDAEKYHNTQIVRWSVYSIIAFFLFLGAAFVMVDWEFDKSLKWGVIYYSAVRLAILTSFGAIAAFCIRGLKSHLHMKEHNLHRKRIANSMEAFVESAINDNQRDYILAHLVNAIATFGQSGLLGKEENTGSKMTIESIMKNIGPGNLDQ